MQVGGKAVALIALIMALLGGGLAFGLFLLGLAPIWLVPVAALAAVIGGTLAILALGILMMFIIWTVGGSH